LRHAGGAEMIVRNHEGDIVVSERSQENKPRSDFLGAFGFVVLVLTIVYAVWTAT
jgi:hypothetical protein